MKKKKGLSRFENEEKNRKNTIEKEEGRRFSEYDVGMKFHRLFCRMTLVPFVFFLFLFSCFFFFSFFVPIHLNV